MKRSCRRSLRLYTLLALTGMFLLQLGLSTGASAQVVTPADSSRIMDSLVIDQFNGAFQDERFDAAVRWLARLDSSQTVSRWTLIQLHDRLATGPTQIQANDTVAMYREEAQLRLRIVQQEQVLRLLAKPPVTRDRRAFEAAKRAWSQLERAMTFVYPDSVPGVVTRAKADLTRYAVALHVPLQVNDWADEMVPDTVWAHLSSAERATFSNWHPPFYRLRGVWAAPRLHADAWLPAPGWSVGDTVIPVAGKVNLICMAGTPTDAPGNMAGYAEPTLAAWIRYWLQRYGSQNLAVTIVWPATSQIVFHHPPWGDAQLEFPSAVAAAGWYLQDYEQLPVTIAVQRPHTETVARGPDGQSVTLQRLQFNDFWTHDPELVWVSRHSGLNGEFLRPAELPGIACAIVGRDGMLEHTTVQGDNFVNTRWAMQLLFEGPGAPPRPRKRQ